MKKSCDKFLPRFDDFVIFVTDGKIHQTLNFYLKSTKANRLAKVIRVLSAAYSLNRALRCSIEQGSEGFTNTFKLRTANLF